MADKVTSHRKEYGDHAQWAAATGLPSEYYRASKGYVAHSYFDELLKLETARDEKLRFEDVNIFRNKPMFQDACEYLIRCISKREKLVERLRIEWERMTREGLERSE